MRAKEGFVLHKMGEQAVVIAVGEATKNFNGMIKLNDTGEFLWKMLEKGANKKQLASALYEDYEVTMEQAESDVERFIEILSKPGIIED
jgi:sensor domain CHASE-containing protein